jgi:hypothetical protein
MYWKRSDNRMKSRCQRADDSPTKTRQVRRVMMIAKEGE